MALLDAMHHFIKSERVKILISTIGDFAYIHKILYNFIGYSPEISSPKKVKIQKP
jgi:hypothetical protein